MEVAGAEGHLGGVLFAAEALEAAEGGSGQRVQGLLELRPQAAQRVGGAGDGRALFRPSGAESSHGDTCCRQAFDKGLGRLVQPEGFEFIPVRSDRGRLEAAQFARQCVFHADVFLGASLNLLCPAPTSFLD
jgi:hypothetical protein